MKSDPEKRKRKAYARKPMSEETKQKLREKLRELNRQSGKQGEATRQFIGM